MAYVIQINFDSYWKLAIPSQVFRFRNREYKLLRGRTRGKSKLSELDCILSLLSKYNSKEHDQVYRDIMIYCACLSIERNTPIIVGGGGGYGNSRKITTRQLERCDTTQRTMPTTMHYLSIERIPYVYNRNQEDAIGLYREGLVSRSPFYQFLCFWNILNIPTRATKIIINWVNYTMTTKKDRIFKNKHINELQKKNIDIGKYLYEECRNAIAHIRRDSTQRKHIDPNNCEDFSRIQSASYFLQDLVKIYMKNELKIDKTQYLYTRSSNKKIIPEYLTEDEIERRVLGK